jgi:formate hydrogenlyase subunit 5
MSPAATGASASPSKLIGSVPELWQAVVHSVAGGNRFAGLMATQRPGGMLLSTHLAGPADITSYEAGLPPGDGSYPALTPLLGAAFWYEREIHDLFGVVPAGHPRLEPLILPLHNGEQPRPRPGAPGAAANRDLA